MLIVLKNSPASKFTSPSVFTYFTSANWHFMAQLVWKILKAVDLGPCKCPAINKVQWCTMVACHLEFSWIFDPAAEAISLLSICPCGSWAVSPKTRTNAVAARSQPQHTNMHSGDDFAAIPSANISGLTCWIQWPLLMQKRRQSRSKQSKSCLPLPSG